MCRLLPIVWPVPIVEPEAGDMVPAGDIIYNVTFDVLGAVLAEINEIEGYAGDSSVAPAAEKEWNDRKINRIPNDIVNSNEPEVRTRSGRIVRPRNVLSPSYLSARSKRNVKIAFGKESDTEEANKQKHGRSEIKQQVCFHR